VAASNSALARQLSALAHDEEPASMIAGGLKLSRGVLLEAAEFYDR
jgi:hypothetical protein